jgi:uncharacterized RDD family membrane protein YckC
MTERWTTNGYDAAAIDVNARPELYDGVLGRRAIAFIVDAIIVGLLFLPLALILFVFGLLTLGLGWFLYPALLPVTWIVYVACTAGGPAAATPGMRIAGLRLMTGSGRSPGPLLALTHSLLFWLSASLLTPLVLLVGLVTDRHRLLHDIVLDMVVVNTAYLPGFRP